MQLPDLALLESLLRDVGREEVLPRFNQVSAQLKADGSVVTEADHASDARTRAALAAAYPQIGFLSEEMDAEQQQALLDSGAPLWCLDPLDGTSNFAAGIPLFGLSLGLIVDGAMALGVIYDPVRDECFSATRGGGARLNGEPLRTPVLELPLKRCVALIDFKRLSPHMRTQLCERAPYSSQRNLGSCALEWGWLAAGRGPLYLHGGQKLWDIAAGVLILDEAGGGSRTLDGDPVFVPRLEPRSVVASPDPALLARWLDWLQYAAEQ